MYFRLTKLEHYEILDLRSVNRFEVVAKRKENYLQVGFKKIFKFDFLQKKNFKGT